MLFCNTVGRSRFSFFFFFSFKRKMSSDWAFVENLNTILIRLESAVGCSPIKYVVGVCVLRCFGIRKMVTLSKPICEIYVIISSPMNFPWVSMVSFALFVFPIRLETIGKHFLFYFQLESTRTFSSNEWTCLNTHSNESIAKKKNQITIYQSVPSERQHRFNRKSLDVLFIRRSFVESRMIEN